jgi:Lon protease-like protein
MSSRIPLFPLGSVLYPGLVLPLHIFEDRYRQLVRDLLAGPQPRAFGVVAIKEGRETGIAGVSALHEIGCTATLRQVDQYEDGRYDLLTVGAERFRLAGLDESRPYWLGDVDLLADEVGDEAAAGLAAQAVTAAFRGYLEALAQRGGGQISVPDLPGEPLLLSYVVAASVIVELPDKQALLAEPDAAARLTAERTLLARETTMLRALPSTPAPDLRYSPYSNN